MRKYIVGLDTETCNGYNDEFGRPCLDDSLVYDIGWQVTDKYGNSYLKRSYIISEIYEDCADLVKEAYFKEKLPQYNKDIVSGKRQLASIWTIRNQLFEDMQRYKTNIIFAHNAKFDVNALNKTIRYITSSRIRFFLKYNTVIWDTLKMSKIITARKSYQDFCIKNGFMTNHSTPQPHRKAETIYAYITKNPNFKESHTGLEDVMIETEILAYCFKQKKKMEKELFGGR